MKNIKINIKHILKNHAYRNIPLSFDEAYSLGEYVLEGCKGNKLAQIQSIAALCALHTKATYSWEENKNREKEHNDNHSLPKNAAEQIAGICAAVFEHDIAVSEFGFLNPNVPYAIDNCGMGGDLIITANISTIAAFIAASAGIPMCKHGSPANADEGKYGSSDFLSIICGINTYATKKEIENCVEIYNFGYTEALDTRYKQIHIQTHRVAMLPHMNDIIGPMTNPLNPQKMTRRVLGVNHLISPRIIAEAYIILNKKRITHLKHGLFIRGFVDNARVKGIDELSICSSGTQVAELKDNKIQEYNLFARDFGIQPIPSYMVSPVGDKGQYSLKILKGEIKGPRLELILANAAIIFYLAEKSENFKECYSMAKETMLSGKPYKTMLSVKRLLSRKK